MDITAACMVITVLIMRWSSLTLQNLVTMGFVLIDIVTLTIWGVSNESEENFQHGDTIYGTPNPIQVTYKVIKVVPN